MSSQSICNGHGVCGCDGRCECEDPPYSGQFCEFCSGDERCFENYCDSNRNCSNCALDLVVAMVDDRTLEEFFSPENLNNLPPGTTMREVGGVMEVRLPDGYCDQCSNGVVIISGAETAEYDIDGKIGASKEKD